MPSGTLAQETWRRFKTNKLALAGGVVVVLLFVVSILAPFVSPHDPNKFHLKRVLEAPSWDHPLGTDELGRDIFSRILYGTRISLETALMAVGLSLLIGVPLGAVAGASAWYVDETIMRITDIFLSFPSLLLAIAIAALLGPSLQNAMLAIGISWWPWYTRIVRGQAASIKERQFVKAARAIGTPSVKIIFGHILPNCIAPVIVQASLDIGSVILMIASLSFLGLGAQPPSPEWGLMVSTGRNYILTAWWYSLFPGLAIFLAVLAFNLLGDGLREILDPKTRQK